MCVALSCRQTCCRYVSMWVWWRGVEEEVDKGENGGGRYLYGLQLALSRAMSLMCNNVLHQRQLNSNAISQNACISQGAAAPPAAAAAMSYWSLLSTLWKFPASKHKCSGGVEVGMRGKEWRGSMMETGCNFQFRAHFAQIIEISFFCCVYWHKSQTHLT